MRPKEKTALPRYRVIHRETGETWEVEAPFADDARRVVGWNVGTCRVILAPDETDIEFEDSRVATQVDPPVLGKSIVCPECNITMTPKPDQELWWQCPACDLQYYEWENRFYRDDELVE